MKIHPLHTDPNVQRAVDASGDPKSRTGRTTITALQCITEALRKPGKRIPVVDHNPYPKSDVHLLWRIQDMVQQLGLKHLSFHRNEADSKAPYFYVLFGVLDEVKPEPDATQDGASQPWMPSTYYNSDQWWFRELEKLWVSAVSVHKDVDYDTKRAARIAMNLMLTVEAERESKPPEPKAPPAYPPWQPIDTAPRDGSALLVMRDDWPGAENGRAESCTNHNTYVAGWWKGDEAWICYMDQVQEPQCPVVPTHWMPLPPPPSQQPEVKS